MVDNPTIAASTEIDPVPADKTTINEQDETEGTDVNSAAPEGEESSKEDEDEPAAPPFPAPQVHSVTVKKEGTHTLFTAQVWTALGWVEKRITRAAHLTAEEIGRIIADVENW